MLSFSNAALLACKGLASSSLLPFCGDSLPFSPGPLFSAPDCEPGELRFEASGRALLVLTDSRPLAGLVPAVRDATLEETDGWRLGLAGGPIDDLVALVEAARVFAPAAPALAFAGVPVREVDALEVAVPSCFVGDLVGD